MLKLVQPIETSTIPYDSAVVAGKKIVADIEDMQWRLGALADRLEPKYGDATLARFAEELGINYRTLKNMRCVTRAWQESDCRPSFCIGQSLMAHPNREEIVRKNPFLTVHAARALSRELREPAKEIVAADPIQEECADCDGPEEFWVRSLGNILGDVLSIRAMWTKLYPGWEKFEIPSSHVTLAKQAAKELNQLASELRSFARVKD